ncbi:MAG: enoyl-CoA hydratase/isomerase family protein [Candidatus Eremiobacteraeota bacterium]|nr:enoyl-CoA hydratase/isomerase family protein [Candidatus Eremiobacteraeota bacterium]
MIETPILLDAIRADSGRVIASNAAASLLDLDDGVLCLEFHSKGNTVDANTLIIAEHANQIIPGAYRGLVVGNQGSNFSFGANLRWLLTMLDDIGDDREQFHIAAKRFQNVTTGMRAAPFPTVAAPFGLTIGGGLELSMYADRVVASEDLRAGLPEMAVGILPDLGGTSELYLRALDDAGPGNEEQALRRAFEIIGMNKSSKNAAHARKLLFLRSADIVLEDRAILLSRAKAEVLALAPEYRAPQPRADIPVLGDRGFAELEQGILAAVGADMITAYDGEIARALGRVMTGGPGHPRKLSHLELLDLETHYFETLIWNPKTRDRMTHMLAHGTPLRN